MRTRAQILMPAGCGPHGGAWWPKAENLSVSLPSQTAAATVKKLRESGVQLAMFTGDNQAIAVRIASVLGIAVVLGKSDFFNVEGTTALPHATLYKMHQKPLLGGDLMRRSG